jgi:hypothetical protein
MNSVGPHSTPILHVDAGHGVGMNCQYTYTTCHTAFIPADTTSSLLFAGQPVLSATDEFFGSTQYPMDIYQPPPHVVDYWFDRLGLSLDPRSSENPSNATGSAFQFPPFDSDSYVSLKLFILCRTTSLGLVYTPKGISEIFLLDRLWYRK